MSIVYVSLVILFLLLIGGKLHRKEQQKKRVIRVVADNCTRCRSCLKKCNHHVLEMVNDENGVRIEVRYPDKCSGCGDCIGACRFNALEFVERI